MIKREQETPVEHSGGNEPAPIAANEVSRRIIIVDDHALFRHGIRLLIESLMLDWELQECESFRELSEIAEQKKPDLVLLDLHLPDCSVDQILVEISSGALDAPVIVLSADDDPRTVRRAIDHGAMSFISKASTYQELIRAISSVLGSQIQLPRSVAIEQDVNHEEKQAVIEMLHSLTDRQREILWYLVQGKPNKSIATLLDVTEFTVKGHITRILATLKVKNRTEAVYKLAASEIDLARLPD